MKKMISIILILATIFSLTAATFLYKPKEAKAFLGIGDVSIDPVQFIKEQILDKLVKPIARHMMVRLQQEIARWAQGGFSDQNKPFAMTSWKEEYQGALQAASSKFVAKLRWTPLCAPIKVSLTAALGIGVLPYGRVPYEVYGACTLGDVIDNLEEFWKNPSISVYGWDSWTALTRPNNNFLGAAMMALEEKERMEEEEITEQEKEIEAGQGIKNDTICTKTDQELCAETCNASYDAFINNFPNPIYVACMNSCEKSSVGACVQEQIRAMGSEIKESIDSVIGSDMNWLISADEITEMIGIVFSGLFNKLTHGVNGLLTKSSSSISATSLNQEEYGYYKEYKKTQTPADISKLRTDIFTNILGSIKNVSASGYDCNKDNQLKGETYQEVAADILHEESQHLYTTMEGVDLKPDFEVLDTSQAVASGIAIYGETWDDIPFSRYPEKCASIADKKCSSILTGLPYELNSENINSECATGCHETINNYRLQGTSDTDAINQAVTDGKCSSFTIGNACLQGGYLIDKTKNRCDECVKKYQDLCELKTTQAEKDACIEQSCGNYEDISSSIGSGQDFYNRCTLYETKYSCEVCLKEYFMPAGYCGEVYDFINRAFVKYPALVYENMWWGQFYNFADCAENRTSNQRVFVGLTCRILPDFKFPGLGTCKTLCDVTEEELRNTADNKPTDLDCGLREWGAGAYHPGGQYIPFVVNKKIPCCAALTGHEPELYAKCRGTTAEAQVVCTYATPVDQEPWCYCNNGERPLGFTRTGLPRTSGLGGDCADFTFNFSGRVRAYTDNSPGGAVIYFATGNGCTETNEKCENTTGDDTNESDGRPPEDTTPCLTPAPAYTEDANPSSGVISGCTWEPSSRRTDLYCNLSGQTHAGAYYDDNSDRETGVHVCAPCDPDDADYPYYGTEFDQCNGKAK